MRHPLTSDSLEEYLNRSSFSEELKPKLKKTSVLVASDSIWSNIYEPLLKLCKVYQECSNLLKILQSASNSTHYSLAKNNKKYCDKLIASLIKDCFVILYPDAKETILETFDRGDFRLFRSAFQAESCSSSLKEKLKIDSHIQLFLHYYQPLYLLHIIFLSQYHFIQDAFNKIKENIRAIGSEYKNLAPKIQQSSFLKILEEESKQTVLLWKRKKKDPIPTLTTPQKAAEYIHQNCLIM